MTCLTHSHFSPPRLPDRLVCLDAGLLIVSHFAIGLKPFRSHTCGPFGKLIPVSFKSAMKAMKKAAAAAPAPAMKKAMKKAMKAMKAK